MTAGPGVRIGDTERETAAANLREHYARGRLTLDEFQQRLDAVFAARTDADLAKITADLPTPARTPRRGHRSSRPAPADPAALSQAPPASSAPALVRVTGGRTRPGPGPGRPSR